MDNFLKPAWIEGMKILPEHFQQQDAYFHHVITQRAYYLYSNNWGLRTIKFDKALLSLGEIDVLEVSGVFQNGTVFHYTKSLETRLALSPEQLKHAELVYLGIPHENPYRLSKKQVQDINDSSKQAAEIIHYSANLVLLTDKDDINQFNVLALSKLLGFSADGQPIFDEAFMPPSLDIKTVSWLSEKLEYLIKLLHKRHEIIKYSITQPLQSQSVASRSDLWLLSILNRSICRLELLRSKSNLHPEILYDSLHEMLAELMIIYENENKLTQLKKYEHANSAHAFIYLMDKLTGYLQTQEHHQATEVILNKSAEGMWCGLINSTLLSDTATVMMTLYLDNSFNLKQISPENDIKVFSKQVIDKYVKLQLPGLALVAQTTIPPQIPYQANTNYYLFDTKSNLWEQIIRDGEIAILLNNELEKATLRLWIIPNK